MRIVRFAGKGAVEIDDAPEPVPGSGEVLIETAVSALCGSEMHSFRGAGLPHGNEGHEAAGIVIKLGEGVSNLRVGQRVGVSAISGCGRCTYCASGQYTFCRAWKYYRNMHAERFLAAANACHLLPDEIPWEPGVLLSGDGLGVPYHTSTKIALPEIKTVAVFGVGPVGLGNVLVQAHLGRCVIAVDVFPARLSLAQRLGATHVVNAKETEPVEQVYKMTGGTGADACIEAAGRPETVLACFAALRTAGTLIFNGEQGAVPISPSEHFIRREITAIGSWYYHFSEFNSMLGLYRNGLRVQELISDRFSLTEAPAAYQKFSSGQSGKVILCYEK